jgi:hypothetical protein
MLKEKGFAEAPAQATKGMKKRKYPSLYYPALVIFIFSCAIAFSAPFSGVLLPKKRGREDFRFCYRFLRNQ